MRSLRAFLLAFAALVVSFPALADVPNGGCRCASGTIIDLAAALPLLAMGVLLARRGAR
jgi:hypothetical protein